MSSDTYAIVFKGDVVEGHQPAAVQAQLAKLLKLDPAKAKALFSGKQIVLKKTADKAEAARYGKALKKTGADVNIRVIKAKPAAAPEPETATVDTSGITLAENDGGDLFDAQPEAEAPELDLSEYAVAENDGSLLVEPAEKIDVNIDLSDYSVAENDGSDLFEAEELDIPEVDVPDFGLDEPGAVLETIQEEKEFVSPDTMGMTLAMAGADLIEEDEKPPEPPPKAPDTSGINLIPNEESGDLNVD